MPNQFFIQDGIIAWFNGPEWDEVALEAFGDAAAQVQAYAMENAPWEDQTGEARFGLTTEVAKEEGLIFMTLFHTVDYGYWLELIQSGRFAIIMPTLEAQGARVMAEAAEVVGKARKGND